jgi:hypothetical protein
MSLFRRANEGFPERRKSEIFTKIFVDIVSKRIEAMELFRDATRPAPLTVTSVREIGTFWCAEQRAGLVSKHKGFYKKGSEGQIMIEKANADYVVNSSFVVMVTPEQLRNIANCMEARIKSTLPGQNLTYPLTRRVLLMHDPEMTIEKMEKELIAEALGAIPSSPLEASTPP